MWATIAAALKKTAVAILSNKKWRNKVFTFIIVSTVAIFMPMAAALAIFSGKVEFTPDQLKQVSDNLDVEELAKLTKIQENLDAIEEAMEEADMEDRYEEAQALYLLGLYDYADEKDFVKRLVGCFEEDQSDKQLIRAVNREFGSDIDPDDYIKVVNGMRSTTINPHIFKNPSTKNNEDIVAWAWEAYRDGWGYVWGSYGRVLTSEYFSELCNQYPDHVEVYHDYIQKHYLGKRVADCAGLIKGYLWYNPGSGQIGYSSSNDYGANSMYNAASQKGPISSMPDIPGLGVWHSGHVGIYIGDGYVIQAMGTKYGVVMTRLSGSSFTHWFKIPGITYP